MFNEEEDKAFLLVEIPFYEKNEFLSKTLKDRNTHPACKVYEGFCSCGVSYVGETKRNVEQRWSEHRPPHIFEPANHLEENSSHFFTWKVINDTPTLTIEKERT